MHTHTSTSRFAAGRAAACTAFAAVVFGAASLFADSGGGPGGAPACYFNFTKSCGALHANQGRKCTNGANITPCGDVIIQDAQVNDVRAKSGDEAGSLGPIHNTAPISVIIDSYECSGPNNTGNCNWLGTLTKTCTGRQATGSGC